MSRDTPREASLRAEHARLTVRILAYEFPDTLEPWDADWLRGELEIVAGPSQTFRAMQPLTIEADYLGHFCREIRAVADDIGEDAGFFHTESSAFIAIEMWPGGERGTLDALLHDTAGASMFLEDMLIERHTIRGAAREFDALTQAFPPRAVSVE